jgi:hypothetical protein
MPEPYDYTSAFANLPTVGDSIMGGIKNGVTLENLQAQQQQQQAALAQQQQQKQVVQSLVNNPNATADDYAKAAVLVPQLSAQFKQAWDTKSTAQQQADLGDMVQWSSAIQAKQPAIASQAMRDKAQALENTAGAPTPQSRALRAKADQVDANPDAANFILKSMIAANPNGAKAIDGIVAQNKDQREQDLAPAAVQKASADATSAQDDATLKGQQITAQKAGALSKVPGLKPAQVLTFLQSEGNAGRIAPDDLATLKSNVPTDPAALPGFLNSIMTSGVKPDDQQKYLTPDANAVLSARTQVQTTGMNNATQMAVQKEISAREDSKDDGDATNFTPQAIDNAAARYNLDGTLPPMGMGKAASAGRTAILNRAAEMKAGVDPEQQRRDQLANKQGIANQGRAVAAFNTGKQGNAVRSFNVLLSHLDTLSNLSDALDNGNIQAVNRLGNAYATATGQAAPTNFNSVKHIVADEVVKAITGGAGALGDREESAKAIKDTNSPAQLKGVIQNIKQLSVGQLSGLEQQYQSSTGLNDFEHYLSPAARLMRVQHGGGTNANSGAGKVVDFGSLK